MSISFDATIAVPDDVLASELDGQVVLLSLTAEAYFGLGNVGARAWQLLAAGDSIQKVYDTLLDEYDVSGETLRHDLTELLDTLVQRRLVSLVSV